jgi:hypothetical protein
VSEREELCRADGVVEDTYGREREWFCYSPVVPGTEFCELHQPEDEDEDEIQ